MRCAPACLAITDAVVGALVELSTRRMPAALNQAGIVRDRATAGVLRGYLGEGDRTTIALSRNDVASMLSQIDRQLTWAAASVPQVRYAVVAELREGPRRVQHLLRFVDQMLLKAETVTVTGANVYDAALPALESFTALSARQATKSCS